MRRRLRSPPAARCPPTIRRSRAARAARIRAACRRKSRPHLEKAKNEPKNFEAQVKAAELYYKIGRFDPSIEFLLKANQLKPDDYETLVALGLVNMDAGHFEVADKWYRAAFMKKKDDVRVLAGLSAVSLGKGDARAAEEAIANLEKFDPNSEDLPQFKENLQA